jgi:Leucine-rich repeat (LRR) protein
LGWLGLFNNQITDARPLKGLLLNQKNAGNKVLSISGSMRGNPLQTPPIEVIDSGNLDAFLKWAEGDQNIDPAGDNQEQNDAQNQDNTSITDQDQKIILELEKEIGTQIPKVDAIDSEAPDSFIGYTLDSQGRVADLSIPGNLLESGFKIKNHDLELIGKLTSLKGLYLNHNHVAQIQGLENLTSLQYLGLAENKISQIEGLDTMVNLKQLNLDNNQITQIRGLDKLTNLQTLGLSVNQITKIEGLDNLTNLQELWLGANQITQIEGLTNLTNLQALNLVYNQITKVQQLDNLTSLWKLSLGENQITDATPLKALLLNQKNAGKKVLNISGSMHENPLQTPPVEVIDSGSDTFLEWLEENDK